MDDLEALLDEEGEELFDEEGENYQQFLRVRFCTQSCACSRE